MQSPRAGPHASRSTLEIVRNLRILVVEAVFLELPAFERKRARYLDDEGFRRLQLELLRNPLAGEVIQDTGGLRKLRFGDERRGKGKRGGLRVIYYYWMTRYEFLLFTLYDKDEAVDLTARERDHFRRYLRSELQARTR